MNKDEYQAINDVIAGALTAAGVPVTKEPVGLARLDGKRPDGLLTLISWQGGKPLTWDVTVVSTLADSYLHSTSHSAGSAAETASGRKETKYSSLPPDFIFQPVAIRYDTRCYFNVRSKADISQLNLPHGTDN